MHAVFLCTPQMNGGHVGVLGGRAVARQTQAKTNRGVTKCMHFIANSLEKSPVSTYYLLSKRRLGKRLRARVEIHMVENTCVTDALHAAYHAL